MSTAWVLPFLHKALALFIQDAESSKQASSGNWGSRFRSSMHHSVQMARLESLLGTAVQPATLAPPTAAITPAVDVSSASSQVSVLYCGMVIPLLLLLFCVRCEPAYCRWL